VTRRKKQQADNRADPRGGAWAGLPHCVLDSPAYRHLGLCGRAVLVEIVREMNGYNNGKIGISQRQLSERLRTTNFAAISRAIAELVSHGLIDVAVEGVWKQRMARQYRLTFVSTGSVETFRPATNEYRDWRPTEKSSDDEASAERVQSADTASARPRKLDDAASARIAQNRLKKAKSVPAAADAASSLISKPYPRPKTGGADEGNTPSITPQISGAEKSAVPTVTSAALAHARKIGAIQ